MITTIIVIIIIIIRTVIILQVMPTLSYALSLRVILVIGSKFKLFVLIPLCL